MARDPGIAGCFVFIFDPTSVALSRPLISCRGAFLVFLYCQASRFGMSEKRRLYFSIFQVTDLYFFRQPETVVLYDYRKKWQEIL